MTGIPVSEWRREFEEDDRVVATAVKLLQKRKQ